jgi:hypothetical protein
MQFRKTPFALAAIALASASPLCAQTSSVTIQAESMALSSYAVENGNRIKLTAAKGTATKGFGVAAGTYDVQVYVQPESDGQSILEVYKGGTLLQKYTYPLSDTATSFTIRNVAVSSGETLKLVGTANAGAVARVDKVVLTPVAASTPPSPTSSTPYSGTPVALPKAFQAVNFDKGGQSVAYLDLSGGNSGGLYRTAEDVDITATTDSQGGGYTVSNFQSGEWLKYTVNVPSNGLYDLAIRAAASQSTAAAFHIEVDGVNVTGPITVPNTGNLNTYQWVGKQAVSLTAGKRVLKVVSDQQYFNMDAVSVLASSTGTSAPLTIEAESMALASYAVENGNRIKLTAASGTATKGFSGASGTYDMQVYVQPESDGQSTLAVYKGATLLQKYTYPLSDTATSFTIKNVAVSSGETLKLVGTANAGAVARVDKMVLTPVSTTSTSTTTTPTTTPTTTTTAACANPSGGYEGFGRNATGGAGKPIYRVTNLNDSGAGSLRDAVSAGNRCVVFDVAGTITLSSQLNVRGGSITIDGFTAPAPGITVRGGGLSLQGGLGATNVVLRGVRVRNVPADGISIYNASNIVVDQVSVSGFMDGAIDVTENSRDVTIQWSIIGNGGAANHNFPNLIGYRTLRVSSHHNLYSNGDYRHPYCGTNNGTTTLPSEVVCDVRNNLMWDYGGHGTAVMDSGTANIINNYYYTTKSSASNTINIGYIGVAGAYVSGNYSQNGWSINGVGNRSTPYAAVAPRTTDAVTAAREVIARAGARGPKFGLDAADQTYVGQVKLPSGL